MSFEGYYQVICEKGHLSTEGLDFYEDTWKCPYCESKCAWTNIVDTTNGSYDEKGRRIDGYKKLKIKKPAKKCKCEKCGNEHIVEVATYEMPKTKTRK